MDRQPHTDAILDIFSRISAIPRPSGKEEKIRNWVLDWARTHHFSHDVDECGNVLCRIPASKGYEQAPTIILQSHLDMVAYKLPGLAHDFERDPIATHVDGEWLRANGTTLGADNGIGMALSMWAALDPHAIHPPLELLFTVDEETGLVGASRIAENWLTGKIMINLDSETEGVFTIGCAGGRNISIEFNAGQTLPIPSNWHQHLLRISGFPGGHSGIDINLLRGNAIVTLRRLLDHLSASSIPLHLVACDAGKLHNAIPDSAWVIIATPPSAEQKIPQICTALSEQLRHEFDHLDSTISISIEKPKPAKTMWAKSATERFGRLLLTLPNGPSRINPRSAAIVDTSCNIASLTIEHARAAILISLRSTINSTLQELTERIIAAAALAKAAAKTGSAYEGWHPNWDSPLLRRACERYRNLFNHDPVVEICHAGLEVGVICTRYPDLDAISMGPTIQFPHSAHEQLHIPSLSPTYALIASLLTSYTE